ncbi:MAG: hypothetical protein LJE69_15140 [Thiohalocapsa sp.]|uniref:hypothetical protein n=1 Tax=Thiohalocapsa sp. TaxID=2497641 RepID=UPI0025D4724D|nr:hypothetical protein [Thiohalocapsa sp.]MCG6942573.1 hypothetical protein [Thiohalocapsa sp.]
MKFQMLPRLTSMLAVWLVLLLWQLSAQHAGDLGALAFLLVLGLSVTLSGAEWALCRRHAFRSQYLVDDGWLDRLMRIAPLVVTAEIVKALLLTLLLMTAALSLDLRGWSVLLLDVVILALLMPRLPGLLADAVKRTYLFALARRWAVWFSTLLLWGESIAVLLLAGGDDYRGLSWRAALEYSMPDGRVQAQGLVDAMLRLHAGAKGLGAWSMSVLRDGGSPDQQVAALLVVAAALSVSLLVALAYSQALIGALARPLAIWRPRPRRQAGGEVFEAWWL